MNEDFPRKAELYAEIADLRARVAKLRELHIPFKIYGPCSHEHTEKDIELGLAHITEELEWNWKRPMTNEYTSTTDEVSSYYSTGRYETHFSDSPPMGKPEDEFNRWLASHDLELREQIAREIEALRKAKIELGYDDYNDGVMDSTEIARRKK